LKDENFKIARPEPSPAKIERNLQFSLCNSQFSIGRLPGTQLAMIADSRQLFGLFAAS
jgi:hypothetical protein